MPKSGSSGGDGVATVFQKVRARVPLKLLPAKLSDVGAAIQQELAGMLLRLNPALGGVPVAFNDVKISEDDCAIFEDQPQLHVNVACTFLLFAPKIGQSLAGVVNNIAEDSVGVLILETFNASIPYEELAPSFVYEEKMSCWKRKKGKGGSIAVGDVIEFKCTGIKSADTVVQVTGTPLLSEGSVRKPKEGDADEGGNAGASNGKETKDKKERKKRKGAEPATTGEDSEETAAAEAGTEGDLKSKKKKKSVKKS